MSWMSWMSWMDLNLACSISKRAVSLITEDYIRQFGMSHCCSRFTINDRRHLPQLVGRNVPINEISSAD